MKCIYVMLVALALPVYAQTQIPNAGFEQWDSTATYHGPTGWFSQMLGMGRASTAHGGTSAVRLWNWYAEVQGFLMSGPQRSNFYDMRDAGVPITWMPARLTGYYMFDPGKTMSGHDSAVVMVWLRRYNEATQSADTLAFVHRTLGPASEFTQFAIDLPNRLPGTVPDTIAIAFLSSDNGLCTSDDAQCCYFTIDDIQLAAPSGVSVDVFSLMSGVRVYPNPAHGTTFDVDASGLAGRAQRLALYASDGRLVRDYDGIDRPRITIDRSGLPAGTYLMELRDGAGRVIARSRVVLE